MITLDRRAAIGLLSAGAIASKAFGAGRPTFRPSQNASPGQDATDAIQQAHAACLQAGGGTILIDQPLTCTSVINRGGTNRTLEFWGDNITLQFVGAGALLFPRTGVDQYRPLLIGGMGKLGAAGPNLLSERCFDAQITPLQGPIPKGARSVRLDGHADFKPGDIAYIRTGQLLPKSNAEPDAELAMVTAFDGQTITFAQGLSKPYQQEYYGPNNVTSPTPGGRPAPFGIANVTDRVMRNFAMMNPRITGADTLQLVSFWSVWGFTSQGGLITFDDLGVGSRDSRNVNWTTPLDHTGRINAGSYAIAPSTGCTDWNVDWDVRSSGFTYLHIHEGVARSTFRGSLRNAGQGGAGPGLSIAARAYDINIPDVDIDTGSSQQAGIIIDKDATGGVHFGRNVTVRNQSRVGSAIRVDNGQGVTFARKPRFTGQNRVFKQMQPQ